MRSFETNRQIRRKTVHDCFRDVRFGQSGRSISIFSDSDCRLSHLIFAGAHRLIGTDEHPK